MSSSALQHKANLMQRHLLEAGARYVSDGRGRGAEPQQWVSLGGLAELHGSDRNVAAKGPVSDGRPTSSVVRTISE
jgi:hypothetical protein